MREFFRGWKRKVGCVTLAMACLFSAAWVRGTVAREVFEVRRDFCIAIDNHAISLAKLETLPLPSTSYIAPGEPDPNAEIYSAPNVVAVSFGFAGLESLIAVPFWSLLLPLTIISAWLLLSKPRGKIESAIAEERKP